MVRPLRKNTCINIETFPSIDFFPTLTVSQIQAGFWCSFWYARWTGLCSC